MVHLCKRRNQNKQRWVLSLSIWPEWPPLDLIMPVRSLHSVSLASQSQSVHKKMLRQYTDSSFIWTEFILPYPSHVQCLSTPYFLPLFSRCFKAFSCKASRWKVHFTRRRSDFVWLVFAVVIRKLALGLIEEERKQKRCFWFHECLPISQRKQPTGTVHNTHADGAALPLVCFFDSITGDSSAIKKEWRLEGEGRNRRH